MAMSVRGLNKFLPLVMLLDFVCLQVSLYIGYWLWVSFPWHGNYLPFSDFAVIMWMLPPIGIVVFQGVDLYKPQMGVIGVEEQSLIFKAIWIIYVIGLFLSFFYRGVAFSRLATFYSLFIAIALISVERYVMRHLSEWLNKRGIATRQAVIYGAGFHGQRLARWIMQSPKLGIQVVGYLDDQVDALSKIPKSPPILGGLFDLEQLASEKDVSLVFIAFRNLDEKTVSEIFRLCRVLRVKCWAIPSLYQFHVERIELQNIGGIPLVGVRDHYGRQSYALMKSFFDMVVATILSLLFLPLVLLIACVLKLTSPDPIFFRQIRVGKDGKKFKMTKFRTLRASNAKDAVSPELKPGGKKIDPFRSFLRKSGFDELPQLFHVVKGEMSLVGPRPEMPFLVARYGPLERERLTVKPGITGLWQISEDRKRLLIHENMDYDLYYMEHMSFNLDLAILLKTGLTIIARIFSNKSAG